MQIQETILLLVTLKLHMPSGTIKLRTEKSAWWKIVFLKNCFRGDLTLPVDSKSTAYY